VSQSKKRRSNDSALKKPAAERAQELRSAKRRAIVVKTGLVGAGAVVFAVGMAFAKQSYAGHAKETITTLQAPPKFVKIVKKNLLQAGMAGPAQAPPGAGTAAS
jgi:hypothetical protein